MKNVRQRESDVGFYMELPFRVDCEQVLGCFVREGPPPDSRPSNSQSQRLRTANSLPGIFRQCGDRPAGKSGMITADKPRGLLG